MAAPRPKGIVRKVRRARDRVSALMERETDRSSRYSAGLASEGYNGGYRQALDDILLVINGVTPTTRRFWACDHSWVATEPYLIECQDCGDTEVIKSAGATPDHYFM